MAGSSKSRYVALLRGINVGGNNILPMAKLAALFEKAGCAEIQTYIQSGNVVFSADAKCAQTICDLISNAIKKGFGFQPTVVLRTAGQMANVVASNPFLKSAVDTSALHVGFLSDSPTPSAIAALDANRSAGDFFAIKGREIYLNLASGMGKTKLTNVYFDSVLKSVSTFRNWRTVQKLAELSAQSTK